jgi:putative ABC transport system substrate-binding protein
MRLKSPLVVLVLALVGLGAVDRADAQAAANLPRIGFLGNTTPELEANLVGPFRDGLRDLGYVDGRTIQVEYRWAGPRR